MKLAEKKDDSSVDLPTSVIELVPNNVTTDNVINNSNAKVKHKGNHVEAETRCLDKNLIITVIQPRIKRDKSLVKYVEENKKRVKFSVNYVQRCNEGFIGGENVLRKQKQNEKSILKNKNTLYDDCQTRLKNNSCTIKENISKSVIDKSFTNENKILLQKTDLPCSLPNVVRLKNTIIKHCAPHSENDKNALCDKGSTSELYTANNTQEIAKSAISAEGNGLWGVCPSAEMPIKRERSYLVPINSQCHPKIIPLHKRRGSFKLKRHLPTESENVKDNLSENQFKCGKSMNNSIKYSKTTSGQPKTNNHPGNVVSILTSDKNDEASRAGGKAYKDQLRPKRQNKQPQQKVKSDTCSSKSGIRPRSNLTRCVSAAASIGRTVTCTPAKRSKADEVPSRTDAFPRPKRSSSFLSSLKAQRTNKVSSDPSADSTGKRFESTLQQLRRTVREQKAHIDSLTSKINEQDITEVKANESTFSSQVPPALSVPTSFVSERDDFVGDYFKSHSQAELCLESGVAVGEAQGFQDEVSDFAPLSTMANLRCQSLELFGPKFASLEASTPPLQYSSLISLNAPRRDCDLGEENEMLRQELQETRDHAELLEFRLLEFTEGALGATSACLPSVVDQSTNTTTSEAELDARTQHSPLEDLSLPLSVDSGLELSFLDITKSRFSDYRKSLSRLQEAAGPSEASNATHLSALIDWCSSLIRNEVVDVSGLSLAASLKSPLHKKMGILTPPLEEIQIEENLCSAELTMLAAKLQESLASPKGQDHVLEETIVKLRSVSSSLCRLHCRVHSLTQENKELQAALAALHDATETRTEASGTESEQLARGKTPSLHSDLSDTESDDSSRLSKSNSREGKSSRAMENTASFQESGIFENGCEVAHTATQTLSESDEYLVAALEGEKVTLCKLEYDTIVATERNLQREVEVMQFEKEQLAMQAKLDQSSTKDTMDVLRAQLRLLEKRLVISDRRSREYFDDKCEIEEAENDARLLSQRLESQLEAAREMESLLSSSLSQEQEFCRELQKRVREMQEIDKSRRLHENSLEKENDSYRNRETVLLGANQEQKAQLNFALYGLILSQFWRKIAARNKGAIVPYTFNFIPPVFPAEVPFEFNSGDIRITTPCFPCADECQRCLSAMDVDGYQCRSDADTQTPDFTRIDFMSDFNYVDNGEVDGQRLNDREEFYLMQIQSLQKDRKSLREDYESDRTVLIQQLQNMKADLESLQQNLEDSQREKCKLIFKLEESQAVIHNSEAHLKNQTDELKEDYDQSLRIYEQEQKAMQDQYEDRLVDLRKKLDYHEQRFGALLQQYSILQHELVPYFQNNETSDDFSSSEGGGGKILTTKDLLSAVRELVKAEANAKYKINEMEKKESAYRETINGADRIMSNHVTLYTGRIEELEVGLEQKALRIKQLEASEDRLRATMKSSWKSSEGGARVTELLDRLIEAEHSELQLKERVWNLERNGKELQIKFSEAEKIQENLRGELRDQEELVQRLMSLSSENNALSSQLQGAHEAWRRVNDVQQSESFLKTRVEELEAAESGLREALSHSEQRFAAKERKLSDKLANMDEEISSLRDQLEFRLAECNTFKETESSLRRQIEQLKIQTEALDKELRESSSENISHESQHRSEVTKLRSQLKLCNSQLTDLDSINGELKERLSGTESDIKKVANQLEERSRRHESEVLSLNLQLTQKDSKMDELEAQLQHLSHAKVATELEFLATSPIAKLQSTLDCLVSDAKNCDKCSKEHRVHIETLNECLKTLNEIIHGSQSQSDSESEDSEVTLAESPVTFAHLPLRSLFDDGMMNDPAGLDADTSSICSVPSVFSIASSCTDTNLSDDGPLAPPRPRRDAKKKKRPRKHKTDPSLLDEFEQTSAIPKGSFYGEVPQPPAELRDLEDKVFELEQVITQKDCELRLADQEANELHCRLLEEDGKLEKQIEEATRSKDSVKALRHQLVTTVQQYESSRSQLDDKHEVDLSHLCAKLEAVSREVERLSLKCHAKDGIIDVLLGQIKTILRSAGSMNILINSIQSLSRKKLSVSHKDDILDIKDFDLASVCKILSEPTRATKIPRKQSTAKTRSFSLQFDDSKRSQLPSVAPIASSGPSPPRSAPEAESHKIGATLERVPANACFTAVSTRSLPPLDPRPSRIPRPLSSPLKHEYYPPSQRLAPKSPFVPSQSFPPTQGRTFSSRRFSEPKAELKPLAKILPKSRLPMANVTHKPKVLEEKSSNKFLTDAKKVKRMVTGLAPMRAAVDCSSAPDYALQASPKPEPSCVPRPCELRLTRRVGVDGAVIAWRPLEHDCVVGFQVVVGGRVVQQVKSPHRTKALVTGLPFPNDFTICLIAVAMDGRCSTPAVVSYQGSDAYAIAPPVWRQRNGLQPRPAAAASPAITLRRAVPTCL